MCFFFEPDKRLERATLAPHLADDAEGASSESGQSTVEAALLLPVLFLVLGIIIQPALLLYTQSVMNSAAAEGCRLISTNTSDDACIRAYIERRLCSIPRLDIFHIGSEWELEWSEDDADGASLRIVNHVKPLPFLGLAAQLGNLDDGEGNILQETRASASPLPDWVRTQGYAPSDWIGKWK